MEKAKEIVGKSPPIHAWFHSNQQVSLVRKPLIAEVAGLSSPIRFGCSLQEELSHQVRRNPLGVLGA